MENYRSKFKDEFRWVQEANKHFPFLFVILAFNLWLLTWGQRRAGRGRGILKQSLKGGLDL